MPTLTIDAVDPADHAALLEWNDLLGRAYCHGREAAFFRSGPATLRQFDDPKPGRRSVLLLARADGEPVGALEAHRDADSPVDLEIGVLPDHRRSGVATALVAHLGAALGDDAPLVQSEVYGPAGVAFAQAQGLQIANIEHRLVLDLPVDAGRLAALDRAPADVTVRSWVGACPDDLIDAWVGLNTQMAEDVPLGALSRPSALDVEQTRRNERRMADQGYLLVRSMGFLAGRPVGYTEIFVSTHAPEIITQDDTLVDRGSRGRGIGWALKLANLRRFAALPEAAPARWLVTYTEPHNTAMMTLNERLGFRVADVMTALEGRLRTGSAA